jgi:methionine-gamma-lyase
MKFNPADNIQDLQYFGEFGGVNPSISDSSTYTFLSAKTMFDTFEGNMEGCYLYSRHSSPSNLDRAMAAMEALKQQTYPLPEWELLLLLMQLCGAGDHIVSSRTIYGGTYAFLKNFTPRFDIKTTFVDITKLDAVEAAITQTRRFCIVKP